MNETRLQSYIKYRREFAKEREGYVSDNERWIETIQCPTFAEYHTMVWQSEVLNTLRHRNGMSTLENEKTVKQLERIADEVEVIKFQGRKTGVA